MKRVMFFLLVIFACQNINAQPPGISPTPNNLAVWNTDKDTFLVVAGLTPNQLSGVLAVFDTTGKQMVRLSHSFSNNSITGGAINTYRPNGLTNISLTHGFDTAAYVLLNGQNGNPNFIFAASPGSPFPGNEGVMVINGENGYTKLRNGVFGGVGYIETWGPNGTRNFVAYNTASLNQGQIAVIDENDAWQAGLTIDANGNGIVWGDIKNFKTDHPGQPGKEIWYASLEGPEAAAYTRGTGKLVNGAASISLPEHFRAVASPQGITVMITPLSGKSKGIAVVEKNAQSFSVQELLDGTGNYEFDWEVKAIRKGFENYEVVRDRVEHKAPELLMPLPAAGTN